jgi:thiamine kinase-like enzyme
MQGDFLHALPEDRRRAARAALSALLGITPIIEATPLSGGATQAAVYRIEVPERRYLLRIEGPASPLRNPHQYTSLRIAADAGIAPTLHFADEASGLIIADFIEQKPLHDYPGGSHALAMALGDLLARLQTTETFPAFVEYPDIVARLFAHVRRTGLFAAGLLDRHVGHLERVTAAWRASSGTMVSSHNDANPRNILFDGQRLWLIDWESAYRNDPLIDAAVMLDSFGFSPTEEAAFLAACFGRPPDRTMRARLALARALTRLYFAGVFLSASADARGAAGETDLSAPGLSEFRQAVRTGRLLAGKPETKHVLGKMYLAAFLDGTMPPGFEAAV